MAGFVSATSGRYAVREKYEPLGPDPARLVGRGRTHAGCRAEYQAYEGHVLVALLGDRLTLRRSCQEAQDTFTAAHDSAARVYGETDQADRAAFTV